MKGDETMIYIITILTAAGVILTAILSKTIGYIEQTEQKIREYF